MEQVHFDHTIPSSSQNIISIRREWPQLGRALYQLEHDAVDANPHYTDEQKGAQRQKAREIVLAQCDIHEEQYEAFEVVRLSRAAEIVGTPHYVAAVGHERDLPYTGLEGYYAGSEQQANRPGLTPEQIITEEATIGLGLLNETKKHCVETYSWAHFTKMLRALDQDTAAVEVEDVRTIGFMWTKVVRRLRDRIYRNPEYPGTPLEEVEAMFSNDPALANDPRLLAAYKEIHQLAPEHGQPVHLTYDRQAVFSSRVAEYSQFRDQTYALLRSAPRAAHSVAYAIMDNDFAHATIIETRILPLFAGRNNGPPYLVSLTPEQLEGYLFLSKLGCIGGNPLVRCVLTQEEY